jgi:energy-coupling factor transport system substrate-specific component
MSYFIIAFVSSAACAVIVSTFVDALGIVPYAVLSKIITLNNTLASWIGLILLTAVFRVTRDQFGLFWTDIMDEKDIGKPAAGILGAWLVTVASVVGLLGGMVTGFSAPTVGWISTLAILVGSLLL